MVDSLLKEITPLLKVSAQARATPGNHFLVVYDSGKEMIEQILQFVKIGLMENDHDVVIITDAKSIDLIRERIVTDWKVYLRGIEEDDRIAYYTFSEWCMPDGKFEPQKTLEKLTRIMQHCRETGRKGLRCVVDMNLFFDYGMTQYLLEFEKAQDKTLDMSLIQLCAYTKDRFKKLDRESVKILLDSHDRLIETCSFEVA
jgi:hypothetical protein